MCLVALGSVGNAMATVVYDHADAIGYGDAWHSNPAYQQLGDKWNGEDSAKAVDDSDDGVTWSVNGSEYGNDSVTAGDTVTFKFDVYKQYYGNHEYDLLKVWMDWGQDLSFNNDSDVLTQQTWYVDPDKVDHDNPTGGIADSSKSFYQEVVIPTYAEGDFWLRARVLCNWDLDSGYYNLTGGYAFTDAQAINYYNAYDYFGVQGEVEDWALTVVAAPVPEPSTMLLFGAGLSALGFYRRKHKNA